MRKAMVVLALVAATGLVAQAASAQTAAVKPLSFAVEGNFASDNIDFGVGARAIYNPLGTMLNVQGLKGYVSFDWFFPGNSVTYWEVNPGVTYDLRLAGVRGVAPYVGGGLNISHISVDLGGLFGTASDTKMGLNLLGGARFSVGPVNPFVEARFEISGGELFVLTFGVPF